MRAEVILTVTASNGAAIVVDLYENESISYSSNFNSVSEFTTRGAFSREFRSEVNMIARVMLVKQFAFGVSKGNYIDCAIDSLGTHQPINAILNVFNVIINNDTPVVSTSIKRLGTKCLFDVLGLLRQPHKIASVARLSVNSQRNNRIAVDFNYIFIRVGEVIIGVATKRFKVVGAA